jgi:predicted phosphodiesterase
MGEKTTADSPAAATRHKLWQFIRSIPPWKFALMVLLFITSSTLPIILPFWILNIEGFRGIFYWTSYFRFALYAILVFGFLVMGLLIADFIKAFRTINPIRVPSRFFTVMVLFWTLVPLGGIGWVYYNQFAIDGDKAPMLLMEANTGNGLPNYVVAFYTKEPSQNFLLWGDSPALGSRIDETKASSQHALRMTGLSGATTYYYQINGQGKVYNFTTPAATPNVLSFGVLSDIHIDSLTANQSATANILTNLGTGSTKSDLILTLGDYTELGFQDKAWTKWCNFASSYATGIPLVAAIGNHDNFGGGKQFFGAYFYPDGMDTAGGSKFWHLIRINSINIIVLDLEWGTESYRADQRRWFEQTMATIDPDEWTIVVCHSFFYSSGIFLAGEAWADLPEMIDEFEQTFIDRDVDIVFSGHNHHMEVLNASGIVYNIVGGGGGHSDPDRTIHSDASLWYQSLTYGYARYSINGNQANCTYYSAQNEQLYTVVFTK